MPRRDGRRGGGADSESSGCRTSRGVLDAADRIGPRRTHRSSRHCSGMPETLTCKIVVRSLFRRLMTSSRDMHHRSFRHRVDTLARKMPASGLPPPRTALPRARHNVRCPPPSQPEEQEQYATNAYRIVHNNTVYKLYNLYSSSMTRLTYADRQKHRAMAQLWHCSPIARARSRYPRTDHSAHRAVPGGPKRGFRVHKLANG